MFAPGQHNHVKLTNVINDVHHALCFVHWSAGALWIVSMRFRKVSCLMLRRCNVYWWESRGKLLRKSVFQPFPAFFNPFQSFWKFPFVFKWQVLKMGCERISEFSLLAISAWTLTGTEKSFPFLFCLFSILLSTSVIISPCSQCTF